MPIALYPADWAFACLTRWPRIPATDGHIGGIEMCDTNGLQRLLYLQTENTSVDSEVIGMSFVEDGEIRLPPENTDDWPYANVLEAMKDGWRIIKFPELTLLYHDPQNLSLGCEFILEK